MMKRLLLALPLALPLALAGCPGRQAADATTPVAETAAQAAPEVSPADALPRHHWRLQDATAADGSRIDALFVRADKPVTLDFRDGRVGVSNTCNGMGGSYTLADGRLAIGPLASTMMACADPQLMALDGEVGKRLQGEAQLRLATGDAPTLTLSRGGDTLVFAGEPTAATRYGGAPERVFLEVAADTRPCSHPLIPDKQCLQVRELHYDDKGLKVGEPGAFGHFYDDIEGYVHEPGVRNVLRVDRYTRKDVPADASKYAYVLDMVVESEAPKK